MKIMLMIAVLFGSLFFNPVTVSFAEEAADFHQQARIQRLITAIEVGDHEGVLQLIDQMEKSGVDTGGEILFYKALSSEAVGKLYDASVSAEEYLKLYGNEGKHYQSALEIYGTASQTYDGYLANYYLEKQNIYKFMKDIISYRRSDLAEDFFSYRNTELDLYNSYIINNGDGTISLFYGKKTSKNQLDVYELIWLACPIGAQYNKIKQQCDGDYTYYYAEPWEHHRGDKLLKIIENKFNFNGDSDWRLPTSIEVSQIKFTDYFENRSTTIHNYIFTTVENPDKPNDFGPINYSFDSSNVSMWGKVNNNYCVFNLTGPKDDPNFKGECDDGHSHAPTYMVRGPFKRKTGKLIQSCWDFSGLTHRIHNTEACPIETTDGQQIYIFTLRD